MSKALFYGGAFNPVSLAHVELADYVRKELGFDKVIFVPTKDKYIRFDEGKDFVFSENKRLSLLQEVAKDRDWMVVSDYELTLNEQPRTYFSLKHFQEEYDIKLLMGSDWLPKLQTGWRYVEEITHEFGIVVMTRSDDKLEETIESDSYLQSLRPYITCIQTPDEYRHISSTKIRKLFHDSQFEEVNKLLPKEIDASMLKE